MLGFVLNNVHLDKKKRDPEGEIWACIICSGLDWFVCMLERWIELFIEKMKKE